jgi:hypothetical protein
VDYQLKSVPIHKKSQVKRKKFSPEEIDFIKRFQFHPGAGAGWPLFFWIAFGLNF